MPSVSPSAPSTPGISASRAKVTLSASTFANAGAALCFRMLLDTSIWRDWNHLIPEVTIRSQPSADEWGTPFVSRNPSTTQEGADQTKPPTESTANVRFHEYSSLGISPHSPAKSLTRSDPPSSKEGTVKNLNARDSFESRRRSSVGSPKSSGPSSLAERARNPSISAIGGEPSVRLRLGTTMTFHVVLDQSKPTRYSKTELVVAELMRPGDQPSGEKVVYRIMWESDTNLAFPHSLPKWLLFSQQVTEIRPVVRGDGKEDCEITT